MPPVVVGRAGSGVMRVGELGLYLIDHLLEENKPHTLPGKYMVAGESPSSAKTQIAGFATCLL